MTTEVEDLLAGLITHLKAQAAISDLVSTRVFGLELPAEETPSMPRAAIVMRLSGGVGSGYTTTMELQQPRVDAFSYGATPFEAGKLARRVRAAFKNIQRLKVGTALIHHVLPAGGFADQREPETRWPRVFESFSVMGSEKGAS